ncbi:Arv1-like family-domain-containing protein [Collybia nuda]|uniref:Protein ARV n=1 Tax=Collybia nuda TaxID=64659 RepID=A0A9P5Y151_9AGAR|nr:Arv1-like family-domain-containing protein [Collybia nuda]
MPICTTCTYFTPYLYTVYQSANNLRLEQCSKCQSFADPYVEHDSLTLLLDLILLKRGVYRHLLYNRGTEPRRALGGGGDQKENGATSTEVLNSNREKERWLHILKLGGTLVLLDAFIRWSYLNPDQPTGISPWTKNTFDSIFRVFLGCFAETLAFHSSIMATCWVVQTFIEWAQKLRQRGAPQLESDIKREFRFSLIPLTLFYSSLTKLFLLFLLTIWRPTSTPTQNPTTPSLWDGTMTPSQYLTRAYEILDDDKIDREWVIRNVLGGMSAGFGLRVILDTHPIFTSIIILVGWKLKTVVSGLVSSWVGGDDMAREAWRAYSIP